MKTRRNIKPLTVVKLGLFAALVAGGLLMNRRRPEPDLPAPTPQQAQAAETQSAEHITREQYPAPQTELPEPIKMKTMRPVSGEPGFEMPFGETNRVPLNTSSVMANPAELRAALAAATASGNIRKLAALLHSGDPADEIEAVRLLARNGSGEALAAVLGKLLTVSSDDPNYNRLISAFADCHSAAVADWLAGFLGQTDTEDARLRALEILAALNGPEVINSLAAGLANPIDSLHAKDCAELLAKSSDPQQAAVLRNLLETGETVEIQTSAARGLASVGSGATVTTLIEKGSAAEAVAAVSLDALATVDSSYAQETLIQAAVDPSLPSDVRSAAVQALSKQPSQRTQTVLVNLGQTTGDPALKTIIEEALKTAGQSGTPPPSGSPAGIAEIDGEIWF